jgi:hypothetical protein
MPMKNPPHPGGFVLRQCIEPLGLSITGAAAALGVTRTTLSELVNEKRGISRNGRAAAQGFRRQRRKLAYTASAVRPCARSRRPAETETAGTGVGASPKG